MADAGRTPSLEERAFALAAANGYTREEWDDPENLNMREDYLHAASGRTPSPDEERVFDELVASGQEQSGRTATPEDDDGVPPEDFIAALPEGNRRTITGRGTSPPIMGVYHNPEQRTGLVTLHESWSLDDGRACYGSFASREEAEAAALRMGYRPVAKEYP